MTDQPPQAASGAPTAHASHHLRYTSHDVPSPRLTAKEVLCWVPLLGFLWMSRWLVAPHHLLEWDSANYALGLRHFDVFEHQPHPPGSPVFMALLYLAGLAGGDPVQPFLLVNAVLGAGVLLGLAYLVRREAGPVGAWLAALGMALSPTFWYHGASSTAYVAECFCSVSIAALALAMARRRLPLWLGMAFTAMVLGVRPSGLITLLPLALVGAWLGRPSRRAWLGGGLSGLVVSLLWLVPMVVASGGWHRFSTANDALSDWQFDIGSALGGDFLSAIERTRRLLTYTFDAGNALWPAMVLALYVRLRHGRMGKDLGWFFGAWVVPGTATYVLHHLAKSGYVLTLMPIFFTALVLAVTSAAATLTTGDRVRFHRMVGALGVLYALINLAGFAYAVPGALLARRDARLPDLPSRVLMTGDYGRFGLSYRTWPSEAVTRLVDELDPEQDLVVFLFGTHELHRIQMYYHPDHWLLAAATDHGVAHDSHGETTFGEFQLIVLRAPQLGLTWDTPTTIALQDNMLYLDRNARTMPVELEHAPRRILVVYACPPCSLEIGPGLLEIGAPVVGAGFGATLLAGSSGVTFDDGSSPLLDISLAGSDCM